MLDTGNVKAVVLNVLKLVVFLAIGHWSLLADFREQVCDQRMRINAFHCRSQKPSPVAHTLQRAEALCAV